MSVLLIRRFPVIHLDLRLTFSLEGSTIINREQQQCYKFLLLRSSSREASRTVLYSTELCFKTVHETFTSYGSSINHFIFLNCLVHYILNKSIEGRFCGSFLKSGTFGKKHSTIEQVCRKLSYVSHLRRKDYVNLA